MQAEETCNFVNTSIVLSSRQTRARLGPDVSVHISGRKVCTYVNRLLERIRPAHLFAEHVRIGTMKYVSFLCSSC